MGLERLVEKIAPRWCAGIAGEAVAELCKEENDGELPDGELYRLAESLGIRDKETFIETVLREVKRQ